MSNISQNNSTSRIQDNIKNKYPGRKVKLYFPESNCNNVDFYFSPNEGKQSGFLEPIINADENNDVIEIVIPPLLYNKTRDVELIHFYNLWKGKETVQIYSKYNYKTICELVDAFCLNENLPFVKDLSLMKEKMKN
jgi:GH15 family glucan-1,4-alpha-glucosidase